MFVRWIALYSLGLCIKRASGLADARGWSPSRGIEVHFCHTHRMQCVDPSVLVLAYTCPCTTFMQHGKNESSPSPCLSCATTSLACIRRDPLCVGIQGATDSNLAARRRPMGSFRSRAQPAYSTTRLLPRLPVIMVAAVQAETEVGYKSRRQNAAPVAAIALVKHRARTALITTTMLRHWVGRLRVTVVARRFDKLK
jgi:hypothetical protein